MEIIRGFSIIIFCLFSGDLLSKSLNLLIPGNVLGMILLFLSLYFKIVKLKDIEKVANGLIKILSFLFVPVAVGIILYLDIIYKNAIPLLFSIVISTFAVLLTTGFTVQFLIRDKGGAEEND